MEGFCQIITVCYFDKSVAVFPQKLCCGEVSLVSSDFVCFERFEPFEFLHFSIGGRTISQYFHNRCMDVRFEMFHARHGVFSRCGSVDAVKR